MYEAAGTCRHRGPVQKIRLRRSPESAQGEWWLKLTLLSLTDLEAERDPDNRAVFCLSRLNWTRERSACPPLFRVTWRVWLSSSSGSFQSLCCPQSCRTPSSGLSSSPLRGTEPQPPCCCLVFCQTETLVSCVTFLTSFTLCLKGILITCSCVALFSHLIRHLLDYLQTFIIDISDIPLTFYHCKNVLFKFCLLDHRSAENKMDSSNLSVILAPNLLHSGDGSEKMNAATEKRLKLQAAIVHCFIENACNFGMTWGIFPALPTVCQATLSCTTKHLAVLLCFRCVTTVSSGEGSKHDGLWGRTSVSLSRWTRRAGLKLRAEEENQTELWW